MSPFWVFIEANNDGGDDSWSYKTCKAPVKSSPTNHHPAVYKSDALTFTQSTVSESTEGKSVFCELSCLHNCVQPASVSNPFVYTMNAR